MAKNKPILQRFNDIKHLDRIIVELSPYMNEWEIDQVLELSQLMSSSKFDTNLSIDDCIAQLRMTLGRDRYDEIVMEWTVKNQPLVKQHSNKRKFRHKQTKLLYDGLDDYDNPEDYEEIYL